MDEPDYEEESRGYSDDPDSESEQQMYNEFYHNLTAENEALITTMNNNMSPLHCQSSNEMKYLSPLKVIEEHSTKEISIKILSPICKELTTPSQDKRLSAKKMNANASSPISIDLTSDLNIESKLPKKLNKKRTVSSVIDLSSSSEDVSKLPKKLNKKRTVPSVIDLSSSSEDEFQYFKKRKLENGSNIKLHTVSNSMNFNTSDKMNSIIKKQKLNNSFTNENIDLFNGSSDEELEDILDNMSDDKSLWKVDRKDYYPSPKHSTLCDNCNSRGHLRRFCPKPRKVSRCSLCGKVNHYTESCPNAACNYCNSIGHWDFQCLWKSRASLANCNLCKMTGHYHQECPDTWRRYYLTVEDGPIVESNCEVNDSINISCYNCGSQDHFGHSCKRKFTNKSASRPWPYICSYETPEAQLKTVTKKQDKAYKTKLKYMERSNMRQQNSIHATYSPKRFATRKEPNFPRNNFKQPRPNTVLKDKMKQNKRKNKFNLNKTF